VDKDSSSIPAGKYCYRLVRIQPGEILSKEVARFGKDLREYSHHTGYKEVLCPYWQRTDYGTVRCNFLDREVIDEDDSKAKALIQARFGVTDASNQFGMSYFLSDEIKVCGQREDEDADWCDETDVTENKHDTPGI
jgi:hypothetical protein